MVRRIVTAVLAATAGVLLAVVAWAAPASATGAPAGTPGAWEPVEYQPWDIPAGVRCDFAIHAEPIVNEVRKRVLETYPDGTPKREQYTGDLVTRVTNVDTGAYADADASGDAMIEYRQDGSMIWYVKGPVLVGFGADGGNLPRGLWVIDGTFTIEFSADGYRTVRMAHGTTHNVCTDID